jgi:hypothetical protein
MIRYGKETKLNVEQVIERSVRFFGPGGVGLDVVDRGPGCARFEGSGGYVSVACCEGEKRTRVDLESREWEYQAGQFVGKL